MEVLSEAINLVCYIYDAYINDCEELHAAGAGEETAKSVNLLLCDTAYNVRPGASWRTQVMTRSSRMTWTISAIWLKR